MFDLFRSRDKAVRILLTVLLGLVGLSMVTYLIPTSGTGTGYPGGATGDTTVVATIGKDSLTTQQVSKVVQNMTRSRQMPPELLSIYVPQIVNQLISERAMAYEAGRLGMKVSSDETDNAILDTLPATYVKDGKVDGATLNGLLQAQGMTMADLKDDTARQLLVNRLRQVVSEGVVVSPADVDAEYHHRSDKIAVQYALLTPEKFHAEAEATGAEAKAYYEAHKASFQAPERRDLAVIVIDPAKISAGIHPSDAELQKQYTANQDKFRTPERVNVRHILIKSDASNDAAMKTKAEATLKMIQAGGDFAKIAKDNSQDPGSAVQGGELGWIVKGQTVPEFEKSAFSLQPGQTSGLVKTTYGYHILQVSQHEQAHLQSFEDVKPQLMVQYAMESASQEVQKLSDRVTAELRKDPAHPEKAAAVAGTSVIIASHVQAGDPIPEVGVSKELSDAVAALHKGEITAGPVAIASGKAAIAEVTNFYPAHQASFDEVEPEAHNRASQEKLQALLTKKANDLFAKAQSLGGDLAKAGKEMGLEVKTSPDVDRQGAIEGVGQASTLEDAFTKPVNTLIGPLTAQNGRVVAKAVSRTPADPAAFAAQSAGIRNELKQKKAQDRAQLFEDGIKKRLEAEGKLKVHEDVVNRLVKSYTTRS